MSTTATTNAVILVAAFLMLVFLIVIALNAKDDSGVKQIIFDDENSKFSGKPENPEKAENPNNLKAQNHTYRIRIYRILKKTLTSLEIRCSKVSNIAAYIGIFSTVATIAMTCIINIVNIKAPRIEVKLVDGHYWEWEIDHDVIQPDSLYYCIDEHGHFSNIHNGLPGIWNFRIYNKGNDIADNISVKIDIDEVAFEYFPQPDDYELENHINGIGTYATISTDVGSIDPGQYVDLPNFPAEHTRVDIDNEWNPTPLNDITKNTVLKLTVYSDEGLMLEKTFDCKCDYVAEDRVPECVEYSRESNGEILEYFARKHDEEHYVWLAVTLEEKKLTYALENILFTDPNQQLDNPYPDYSECTEMVEAHKEIPSILYQDEYLHALSKLNVKNPIMRQFYHRKAIFYGRLYYISEGKTAETIVDEKIQMDISAFDVDIDKE